MAAEAQEVGPLTRQLRWWLWHINGPHTSVHQRVLQWARGTPSSLVVTVAATGMVVVDAILSGMFGRRAMFAVRLTIGVYSSACAQLVFMRRGQDLCDILCHLARLAGDLEPLAHRHSKERMRSSAILSERLVRFFLFYGSTSLVLVSMLFAVVKPLWTTPVAGWLLRPITDSEPAVYWLATTLRFAWLPAQCCMALVCIVSFYCLILCMFFIYAASADLYDAIGRGIEVGPCVRGWPSLVRAVLDALLRMDATFARMLPHLLIVSVVLPLLSTVEVVSNGTNADVFALLMAPLILAVFVPLCFVGDNLAAARRGMVRGAGRGPWLEESLPLRRLRLGIMQAAGGRRAQVRVAGVGLLNRRACANALKSWFSFLQVLLNVQRPSMSAG